MSSAVSEVLRLYLDNARTEESEESRQAVIGHLHELSSGAQPRSLISQSFAEALERRYEAGDRLLQERFDISGS